jgi:hypothetical protein
MRLTTALVFLIALAAWAADLPKMSYINENSLLSGFPLGTATKKEVYEAYGPPEKRLTGLPYDGETWSYSQGSQTGKEFTFEFRGDVVYDVIVRYRVGGFEQRSARQMQGAK